MAERVEQQREVDVDVVATHSTERRESAIASNPEHLRVNVNANINAARDALGHTLQKALSTAEDLGRLNIDASTIKNLSLFQAVEVAIDNSIKLAGQPGDRAYELKPGPFGDSIITGTRRKLGTIPGFGALEIFRGSKYDISTFAQGSPTSTSITEVGTVQFKIRHENKTEVGSQQNQGSDVTLRALLVDDRIKNTKVLLMVYGGAAFEGKTIEGLRDKKMTPTGGVQLGMGPVLFSLDLTGYGNDQLLQAMAQAKIKENFQFYAGVQTPLQESKTQGTTGAIGARFTLPGVNRKRK